MQGVKGNTSEGDRRWRGVGGGNRVVASTMEKSAVSCVVQAERVLGPGLFETNILNCLGLPT